MRTPDSLQGRTLRLVVARPSPYTIAWRVIHVANGIATLRAMNSHSEHTESVDALRRAIAAKQLTLEV